MPENWALENWAPRFFGKLGSNFSENWAPAEIWALSEKNGKLGSKILGAVHFGRRSKPPRSQRSLGSTTVT